MHEQYIHIIKRQIKHKVWLQKQLVKRCEPNFVEQNTLLGFVRRCTSIYKESHLFYSKNKWLKCISIKSNISSIKIKTTP